MDESMITESEKFLNKIEKQKLDLSNLKSDFTDLESFLEVYELLNNNLNKLQDIKEDMDESGYTAPFRSLNLYGTRVSETVDNEELGEINRHNSIFRNKATAKKNSLDRVKYAIAAHRIALGNLEEYAKIRCAKCKKSYRVSSFLENSKLCKCGSDELELKVNHSGVHRLEIIPYLPLSGNYMVLLSSLSNWGRESFKMVLNILQQKRKGIVKTVSPIIKIRENGRTITKRVTLDSEFADSYEEEVRRRYGKGVRIERLEFHRTKPTIVNDKHTRTNLALAYVKHAEDIVARHEDEIFEENIKDLNNLKTYDEIIYSVNLEKPDYIDELDLDDWREQKIIDNLHELGLMDKYGHLDKELKRDLKERDRIKKFIFADIAPTLILWDISKYYLCTSYDRRKRYGSPFPYIRNDLDRQQRKVFANPHINVVNLLKEKEKKHMIAVEDMDLLLYKKFKLEKRMKNTNFKLNYAALGPAIVFTSSDYNIKEVSRAYKVSEKSVKREIMNIKSFRKPNSKKSRAFLENIKN